MSSMPATSTITSATSAVHAGEVCSNTNFSTYPTAVKLHDHADGRDGQAALEPQPEHDRR